MTFVPHGRRERCPTAVHVIDVTHPGEVAPSWVDYLNETAPAIEPQGGDTHTTPKHSIDSTGSFRSCPR